jgi:hypothetical protein
MRETFIVIHNFTREREYNNENNVYEVFTSWRNLFGIDCMFRNSNRERK